MTTTTATTAPTRARPLGLAQYLGYACGDAANNLAFTLTSLFLLLYYTDVVGLAAAAVGTMFLVVRLWDAFADLFAGRLVDRTHDPVGQVPPVHPLRLRAAAADQRRSPSACPVGSVPAAQAAVRLHHLRRSSACSTRWSTSPTARSPPP